MNQANTGLKTGAKLLVDALKTHGADTIYCVPGESYLAVLDALYDERERLRVITCRQEGGAANMAEAHGKLTGSPGICMVTRGPGATNASIGVHTAAQDSTPMILFIGQVARDFAGREAFQEVDYQRMFGGMAKWVGEIASADRVVEYVNKAFQIASSGRPGPVVLVLPEDMLVEQAATIPLMPLQRVQASPSAQQMERFFQLLGTAKRPLVLLGGGGWDAAACADIARFTRAWGLPVACAFRFQDLFDNTLDNYVGDVGVAINPALAARIRESDLVIAIGPRLGEMTTSGYTLLTPPRPRQRLVHIHADAEELGSVYQADLMIASGMREFAAALTQAPAPSGVPAWCGHTREGRAAYLAWTARVTIPGDVQMWDVMDHLNSRLPPDAIITNGAGNYTVWAHRFYRYGGFRTQLAPTSGAMGYGVPAAIAAKIVDPSRVVIAMAGDGCFLMNGQELATAVQERANIVVIVVNNGMYGTIRMHQEREYPARTIGTDLTNPDFAALARSFGCSGYTVDNTADFPAALELALSCGKPALIEIQIPQEAITPTTTIAALRQRAKSA